MRLRKFDTISTAPSGLYVVFVLTDVCLTLQRSIKPIEDINQTVYNHIVFEHGSWHLRLFMSHRQGSKVN